MREVTASPGFGVPAAGGLSLLIQTEARIAERLAAADAECRAMLARAEASALAAGAHYDEQLSNSLRALEARIAAERDQEIAEIRAAAARRIGRYAEVRREKIEMLSAAVAQKVLDADTSGVG